jgi:multidrug efflux pump subunit AcrB
VIVFLVLAAQFESFKHPCIIMMTVPLAGGRRPDRAVVHRRVEKVFSQIGASC